MSVEKVPGMPANQGPKIGNVPSVNKAGESGGTGDSPKKAGFEKMFSKLIAEAAGEDQV